MREPRTGLASLHARSTHKLNSHTRGPSGFVRVSMLEGHVFVLGFPVLAQSRHEEMVSKKAKGAKGAQTVKQGSVDLVFWGGSQRHLLLAQGANPKEQAMFPLRRVRTQVLGDPQLIVGFLLFGATETPKACTRSSARARPWRPRASARQSRPRRRPTGRWGTWPRRWSSSHGLDRGARSK